MTPYGLFAVDSWLPRTPPQFGETRILRRMVSRVVRHARLREDTPWGDEAVDAADRPLVPPEIERRVDRKETHVGE